MEEQKGIKGDARMHVFPMQRAIEVQKALEPLGYVVRGCTLKDGYDNYYTLELRLYESGIHFHKSITI